MFKLARLRSLLFPASMGLLILGAVGWYSLIWLPSEHRYLDQRNFRLLTTLSEQISSSIDNFDQMLDHAVASGITDEKALGSYLQNVAPQLSAVEDNEDKKFIANDYGDPPRIAVRPDEGTHFLYLAYRHQAKGINYAVRTDLNKLIRKLLPPDNRSPFDVVLVAQSDGTVIFQKSSQGLTVAQIDALENELGAGKKAKPVSADAAGEVNKTKPESTEAKPSPHSSRFSSSGFAEISLAGSRYRLYSQPVQLSFPLINPGKKSASDKGTLPQPEIWVLCGLVRNDAFGTESQSISYTYILWFSAALLLVVAAYPFLKLHLSNPAERLRARDVFVTAICACGVAATLTFILLDVYHWQTSFAHPVQEQMRVLAQAIDDNFGAEQEKAFKQLDAFDHEKDLHSALRQAQSYRRSLLPQFKGEQGGCDPSWSCRTNILSENKGAPERQLGYPYLQFASWSDPEGEQEVKWTTTGHTTPFIRFDDRSISFYPVIKGAFRDPGGPHPAPTKGIESQYSSNTGEYITVFWQLVDLAGEPVSGKIAPEKMKDVFCAFLVGRPISVVGPVMPAEFQFAIIKPDGTVVFHSDQTRNLRENFFAETDKDREVISRVAMRAPGELLANYMGRGHRMYFYPMTANPSELWTVVVFRDLQIEETINLEVLSLASIMFVLYALVLAFAVILAQWAQRGRGTGSWLWPDSRKAEIYRWLVIVNAVAILLLLVLPTLSLPLALLVAAVVIPAGAVVIHLVALKREADEPSPMPVAENAKFPRWRLGYAATCSTLLAVIAALPCLTFFKVAWDFEQNLFLERSQLRLVNDIDARRESIRSRYEAIKLDKYHAEQLLAEPDKPSNPYFSYHHSFLGTTISPARKDLGTTPAHCGLGSAREQQLCVQSFLSMFSPLYNQIASDGRYLTEASPDRWAWSLGPSGGHEELKLTRREPEHQARTITSSWTPLPVPPGDWRWWLGGAAYLAALFGMAWISVRRTFLLGLPEPHGAQRPPALLGPDNLIAKLSKNMLVVGHGTSPVVANLIRREEVQARDLYQMLSVPRQRAAASGGSAVDVNVPADPVEEIVTDGRPVVFYNFESGLDDPSSNQQILSALEGILSRLHRPVVITTKVDPLVKSCGEGQDEWRLLLQHFLRKELNSCPTRRAGETPEQYEDKNSSRAQYDWLFSGLVKAQKLALVQLAQEKLINPNSHRVVDELIREGLIVRSCGMLAIADEGFSQFLKSALPRGTVKHWESQGAGISSDAVSKFLPILVAGVAGFLLYTQGAMFSTWATGLAVSVPALLKLFDLFRQGNAAEPQTRGA